MCGRTWRLSLMLLAALACLVLSSCELDPAAARNRTATAQASEIASLKATVEAQDRIIAVLMETPTPVPTPLPTPTVQVITVPEGLAESSPTDMATATSASARWKVGNTGGSGVYLRRTPDMGDRIRAWPENTVMERAGDDVTANGRVWHHVKDPAGNLGYIPADFLVPAE